MLVAMSAPAACGGVVSDGDAGADASTDTSSDTFTPPPGCNAEPVTDAQVSCGGKDVLLSGNISSCGVGGNPIPQATCEQICGGPQYSLCTFDSSTSVLTCTSFCTGRFPAGLELREPEGVGAGAYLARAAFLEAASVDAFAMLEQELRAHDAPGSLVRAARRARADEVRHARDVGALAASFGGAIEQPIVARGDVRPLVDVAIENAVEGCVRETLGAIVATWQSEHATDPRVRAAMKRIARDETRHAELGWRIFEWSSAALSRCDAARVRHALARALDDVDETAGEPDAEIAQPLGLPSRAEMRALVTALRSEFWSAPAAA